MSPKFKQYKGYTFKVFSNEEERMHIHIIRDNKEAKVWLQPCVELSHNHGFNTKEISEIIKITEEYAEQFKIQYAKHIGKRIND